MNTIIIKGRLTHTPEVKVLSTGKKVCNFTTAVPTPTDRSKAFFFKCVAWDAAAEFLSKYFIKGQEILITGSMQNRKYMGSDQVEKDIWEVYVREMDFCGPKPNIENK